MPVRYFEELRAPAPTAIGRGATGANLGSRSWRASRAARARVAVLDGRMSQDEARPAGRASS